MGTGRFSVNRGSDEKWFSFSFFLLYIVLSCTYQSCNLVRSLKTWGPAVLPSPLWHKRLHPDSPGFLSYTDSFCMCFTAALMMSARVTSEIQRSILGRCPPDEHWASYFMHCREKVSPPFCTASLENSRFKKSFEKKFGLVSHVFLRLLLISSSRQWKQTTR